MIESGKDVRVIFELPGKVDLDCSLIEEDGGKYLVIEGQVLASLLSRNRLPSFFDPFISF